MLVARAQSLPNSQFFDATARTDEEQVHEIDSADEKQEKHARLHQEQGGPDRLYVIGMQRRHNGAEAHVGSHFGVGIFRRVRLIIRVDLSLRLSEAGARFEPGDHLEAKVGVGMAVSGLAISW